MKRQTWSPLLVEYFDQIRSVFGSFIRYACSSFKRASTGVPVQYNLSFKHLQPCFDVLFVDHNNGTVRHHLSHILARYEPYINHHLIKRYEVNCYSINSWVLVLCLFAMILLLACTYDFSWNFHKKCYLKTSIRIRKCHKCLEINLVWFVWTQFHPKNAMSQSPFFDIDYSGSYRSFLYLENCSGSKSNNTFFTLYHFKNYSTSRDFNWRIILLQRLFIICSYLSFN